MDCLKTLIPCLAILLLLSMISFSEAKDLVVGGKKSSWQVPSSPDKYNKWAETKRFRIGDSIVVKYDGKTDSFLQVSEENYKSCNKSNPVQSYNDGNTRFTLNNSGPFYFISGAEGHCEKGQKLEIRVLSVKPRHSHVAPVPSPAEDHHQYAPAPAPKKNGCSNGLKGSLVAAIPMMVMGVMAFV
ncbi:early nodulin-like protein 1 [Phtheirospermum japonicum]|uniref:Early nodulin-like protein 1 n=1 Tax=Phtheirospermum japonicum TaxID=374723 RepID=A0A830DF58_9LAMI|nr:early nodulin-like protein 1 [Phtheirospermum japonicum]